VDLKGADMGEFLRGKSLNECADEYAHRAYLNLINDYVPEPPEALKEESAVIIGDLKQAYIDGANDRFLQLTKNPELLKKALESAVVQSIGAKDGK